MISRELAERFAEGAQRDDAPSIGRVLILVSVKGARRKACERGIL